VSIVKQINLPMPGDLFVYKSGSRRERERERERERKRDRVNDLLYSNLILPKLSYPKLI
jgi:hypothetical protein